MPIGQCALVARVGYLRDEDLNTEVLVLEDEGSSDRIEIQRALTFDSQDVAQEMDTYCLLRGGAVHPAASFVGTFTRTSRPWSWTLLRRRRSIFRSRSRSRSTIWELYR